MRIVPGDRVGKLVRAGNTAQRRTPVEQVGDGGSSSRLRLRFTQIRRVTRPDSSALNREKILDRNREAAERAISLWVPERVAHIAPDRAVQR